MQSVLSRRSLLSVIGTGCTLSLPWPTWLLAEDRPVPEFSFIIVSDTHLGRQDSTAAARLWTRAAKEIDVLPGDFVLHLGDVVDNGREDQYAVYKDIAKTIRKPIHEIPGNHDPADLFAKHIRKNIDMAFDHKGVRFLLVNNAHRDSHLGFLTAAQLSWLSDQCAEAAKNQLFLVLAMHVPAHTNRAPDRGWYIGPKDGQTELYTLLTRYRDNVLALVHGHFHNGIRGWDDHAPLQEILFPSVCYNQDRGFAKSKPNGYYLNEFRPGYTQVTLTRGNLRLRYYPIGVAEPAERNCEVPHLKW